MKMEDIKTLITSHLNTIGDLSLEYTFTDSVVKDIPKLPKGVQPPPLPPGAKLDVSSRVTINQKGALTVKSGHFIFTWIDQLGGIHPETQTNTYCYDGKKLLYFVKNEDQSRISGAKLTSKIAISPAYGLDGWLVFNGELLDAYLSRFKGAIRHENEDILFTGTDSQGKNLAIRFSSAPTVLIKSIDLVSKDQNIEDKQSLTIHYEQLKNKTIPHSIDVDFTRTSLGNTFESHTMKTIFVPVSNDIDVESSCKLPAGTTVVTDKDGLVELTENSKNFYQLGPDGKRLTQTSPAAIAFFVSLLLVVVSSIIISIRKFIRKKE